MRLKDKASEVGRLLSLSGEGWSWWWSVLLAAVVFVTMAVRYALPIRDGDIWWQMLYGKYLLEHLTLIPDHTLYSWTPTDGSTIYCAWIPEILLYLLYSVSGLLGFYVLRYVCLAIFFLVVLWVAKQLNLVRHPLTWLLCFLGGLSSYVAIFAKPEIFSYVYICLAVLNWWYLRWGKNPGVLNCYMFPLIMLIWVNSHGAFVFGCAFYLLIGTGEFLNAFLCPEHKLKENLRGHFFFSLFLSIGAIFLTPYGWAYPYQFIGGFYASVATNHTPYVAAHVGTFVNEGSFLSMGEVADVQVVMLVVLLLLNLQNKTIEWSLLVSNLGFAVLYTLYLRTTYFWAPLFVISSLQLLSTIPLKWLIQSRYVKQFAACLVSIVVIFLAEHTIVDAKQRPEYFLWNGFGISEFNPVAESDFIKQNYPEARIGNTYNEGAYLLWTVWPENKVFFDSRHFPYKAWTDEFHAFQNGNPRFGTVEPFLAKYPADVWCVGFFYMKVVNWFLQSPDWTPVFAGKTAVVFARKRMPLTDQTIAVSDDFLRPKNYLVARNILTFLINTQKWQMAKRLLSYMENRFTTTTERQNHDLFRHYMKGAVAYAEGDFATAINNLVEGNGKIVNCGNMLSLCYLRLAEHYWLTSGEHKKALLSVLLAWKYNPGSPYALYNAGIIAREIDPEKTISTGADPVFAELDGITQHNNEPLWRVYLKIFTNNVLLNKLFPTYYANALKLLQGDTDEAGNRLLLPLGDGAKP